MESCVCQESSKTLTELQKARLDRLAEVIRSLPTDRKDLLMDSLEKQAFSLTESSELLSCHKETIRRAIKRGDLKAVKLGRDYRIAKNELAKWFKENGGGDLFENKEELKEHE